MNIRFKVLTLKLISTGFLLVAFSLFSKTFLISGFKEVEQEEVLSNTEVLLETFNSMVSTLDNKAADWAAWDDAYLYVQGKNRTFEKVNYLPETMKLLNLDYFAFYDLKGHNISHRSYDRSTSKFVSFPKSIERILQPHSKLLTFAESEISHKGVLKIPEGLIMFSIRPVLSSQSKGPSKGYIFMARRVTDEVAKKLGEITGRSVSFEDPHTAEYNYRLDLQKKYSHVEVSDDIIVGAAVLHDFHNIPVSIIKTELPRKIMQIGTASYAKAMTFITLITILISLGMIHMLDRLLTRRLSDLDQQVNLLSEFGVTYLNVNGNDEIARLAKSMNQMVGTLHARNLELMNLNEIIQSQNQALVSAAKMSALGEMAGGVAHEINTPLTVIKLRSEMMMHELEENLPQGAQHLKSSLQIIDRTVDRITKIIQSLRTFSRETAGQEKIEYSVSAIVSEALNLCHEKFKIHGIDLQYELIEDFTLLCQPTEIAQVLVNLLNNSYDAIEKCEQKMISLTAKRIDDQNIEIAVTDTGEGIPEDIQDKIMNPFFTTKELGKGTGIGLSISKGIVESHGGKLFLDRSAKNTRMVIVLPYLKENITALGQAG